MAGMGVAIRYLPDPEGDRVRITCPAGDQSWDMLERAIRTVMTPQALLFDMDGVLADVSRSYRQAIITTASSFGVEISAEDVARAKTAGNANDDWQLTANLMASRGVERPLAEVKERFEAFYQGAPGRPGLRETETLLVPADVLRRLSRRYQLGIATGRPRADAERFLSRFGLSGCFACCVTREDGPLKPDSFAVSDAMRHLGVERAWMFGDTPDDIRSARGAGALPVGVLPPENSATALEPALITAGAAWVLPSMTSLEGILP
jgi:HAD superfamily hydrolase (TIGR01548 family)